MILWRDMLTYAGVPWVDRGANTSRGHINIKCPWCSDQDPSHHLAIEETSGAYYCRRNPDHYGRSAWRLLGSLGLWKQADRLLDDYSTTPVTRPTRRPEDKKAPAPLGLRPATEVLPALHYLRSRGYDNPEKVVRTFGLTAAPYGRLAARLFFPLTGGETEEYVGRAIRPGLEPRYLTTSEVSRLYMPLPDQYEGGFLFLVEGPFDALRLQLTITEIFGRRFGAAVALLGLSLTSDKRLHLKRLIQEADGTCVVLDDDQESRRGWKIAWSLEALTNKGVVSMACPPGRKDLGDATAEETALWLRSFATERKIASVLK